MGQKAISYYGQQDSGSFTATQQILGTYKESLGKPLSCISSQHSFLIKQVIP